MLGYWSLKEKAFVNLEGSSASLHKVTPTASLLLEGSIFRFVDSTVSFDAERPLESVEQLYLKEGESFVRKIDGLFLLIFQDLKNKKSFLVNNPQQAHRLYYSTQNGSFFFGHKMKELMALAQISPKPNFSSIRSFLSNGFTISEQTQIQGISKLLPADYVVFDESGFELKSYWKGLIPFHRKPFEDLETHLDNYEKTYRNGIERYFERRNPKEVGCLLSGGHDTSYAFLQLSKTFSKPIHAYTVTFPGWTFDEGEYAENISKKFGGTFHPIPFLAEHVDQSLSLILANEEPVVGSSLPLHVLSKEASQTVDTLVGGDGGDTLWGEYYPVGEYHSWVKYWPLVARQMAYQLAKTLRKATDWERFWELEHVAQLFAEANYHDDFLRKLCTYRHFGDEFQKDLLKKDIYQIPPSRSRLEIPFRDDNFSDALIEGKLFNGFYTYQAFHTAKSAEHYGMELFLPTTQKDLIEFITSLPNEWINGGNTFQRLSNSKKINRKFHKKALSRYLDKSEIYNRSFDIPWYNILKPRVHLMDKLKKALLKRGWYNDSCIEQLFSEFKEQKIKTSELLELKHHGYRIFTLLSLEIWSQIYLDGKTTNENNMSLEEFLT